YKRSPTVRTIGGIRSKMEPFPRDTISALGKPTAKIQKISNGQDWWGNSKQDGAFSPGYDFRLGETDGEDTKDLQRSGLLEEFEVRWSLFPWVRFPQGRRQ
ncbi:MAG: hypothetical protein IJJ38_10735, partial [Lachnospiraceae bacterium]|nr:hypothetical protein [Lachnospiraceae bacterium]